MFSPPAYIYTNSLGFCSNAASLVFYISPTKKPKPLLFTVSKMSPSRFERYTRTQLHFSAAMFTYLNLFKTAAIQVIQKEENLEILEVSYSVFEDWFSCTLLKKAYCMD